MKTCKILLAALLAVLMMVSLCACGEPSGPANEPENTTTTKSTTTTTAPAVDDSKTTYTVTVLDDTGAPVVGAMLQGCDDEGCKPFMIPTDATGVVSVQLEKGKTYDVKFMTPIIGYEVDVNKAYAQISDDTTEVTITIKKTV